MKKTVDFYAICTPLERNKHTGNVCVNMSELSRFDRDFIFDQTVHGVKYNKILPKEWVRDHVFSMTCRKKNEITGKTRFITFYALKTDAILGY